MMKLMTMKQYMKMSKPALIRKITKAIRKMPKKRLAIICYEITKAKLPLISRKGLRDVDVYSEAVFGKSPLRKRKALPYNGRIDKRRKKKRKFSRKQLAAQRLFAKRARAGTLRR